MSTVWKEAQEETERKTKEAVAVRMLKNGETEEKTVLYSSLPLVTVQKLAQAVALGTM